MLICEGTLRVTLEGQRVGQEGVIGIEREAELSGDIHDKGC